MYGDIAGIKPNHIHSSHLKLLSPLDNKPLAQTRQPTKIIQKKDQDEYKWNALKEWCIAVNNSKKFGSWEFKQIYKIKDIETLNLNNS